MAREVAVAKRIRISRIKQQMMFAVLIASLSFGVCLVLSIFFIKFIKFNSKVIDEKDKGIQRYYDVIIAVGICKDDGDKRFTHSELEKCHPEEFEAEDVPGTLRYNIMNVMSNNVALESVARDAQSDCYDANGKKKDFKKAYEDAETDEERKTQMEWLKMCSSLRVIPDALPSKENSEALLASLNQIFVKSNWMPESIAPSGNPIPSSVADVMAIPVSLSIEAEQSKTHEVLKNLERSIRAFEISTAKITWITEKNSQTGQESQKLQLQATANAYYSEEKDATSTTKKIYASQKAKKAASQTNGEGEAKK